MGCVGPGSTPVQVDYCERGSQPHTHHSCKGPPCPHAWIRGEWSQVGMDGGVRNDIHHSFCAVLQMCFCLRVCEPVLGQLRYWLPAAHGLLLCDTLPPGSASQHPLPRAPSPQHSAVPPQGMPAPELLESGPVERGETPAHLWSC